MGGVSAQGRAAQRLRDAAGAARPPRCPRSTNRSSQSRSICSRKVKGIEFVTPERPDECCGFGGTFSVFEEPVSAKMGYDKVTDHQRRRRRVHRLRRHVLPDASEGLRRAARACRSVHPYRADPERGPAHETHRPRAKRSSKFIEAKDHLDFHDKRLWDSAQETRPRERASFPSGRSCARWRRRSRSTRLHISPTIWRSSSATRRRNGAQVHWATDAAEHNQIVFDIMSRARRAQRWSRQVDAHRRVRHAARSSRTARHRGHGDRSRASASSSSTTSRRATSSCRRSTSCAATWPGYLRGPSAPTRRTATSTTWPRASASTRGPIS